MDPAEPAHRASPFALAAQRLLLRARGPRARRAVELAYLGVARAGAWYLTRGERGAGVYLRGGPGGADFVPGLSDVDLVVVTAPDGGAGAARVRRRWERLRRRLLPAVGLVLDWPYVYDQAELRDLSGESAFTAGRPVYAAGPANLDAIRAVERPELYGTGADWRLLAGRDRRPYSPPQDRQEQRIAAWLELLMWWRLAFAPLDDPALPRAADLCVKLVAEPARIWLWLAHGERPAGREAALRAALRRLPEEEPALRRALAAKEALTRLPAPAWEELLPLTVRLSARIAALIDGEVAGGDSTEVRLAGDPADLVPGGGLPLADWRAIACPDPPDDAFVLRDEAADDPASYGASAAGPYPALLHGPLLVLPALGLVRTRLRAVKCAAADPVPFALLAGEKLARFPDVRGWSARDTARRAVAEHREQLSRAPVLGGPELGLLLAAARAALFYDSMEGGAPELCTTVAEAARRIGADEALAHYRGFRLAGEEPPPAAVAQLRDSVLGLRSFRGS